MICGRRVRPGYSSGAFGGRGTHLLADIVVYREDGDLRRNVRNAHVREHVRVVKRHPLRHCASEKARRSALAEVRGSQRSGRELTLHGSEGDEEVRHGGVHGHLADVKQETRSRGRKAGRRGMPRERVEGRRRGCASLCWKNGLDVSLPNWEGISSTPHVTQGRMPFPR